MGCDRLNAMLCNTGGKEDAAVHEACNLPEAWLIVWESLQKQERYSGRLKTFVFPWTQALSREKSRSQSQGLVQWHRRETSRTGNNSKCCDNMASVAYKVPDDEKKT